MKTTKFKTDLFINLWQLKHIALVFKIQFGALKEHVIKISFHSIGISLY